MPGSRQSRIATAVADAFGLGLPVADLRPVGGGRSHLMWRLRTTNGEWAVKILNRSREAWWMNGYRIAAQIEQTAWDRAIAMPQPIHPLRPAAPLLADIIVDDAVHSVRVHKWCVGQMLADASPDVLRWVGETLAALHALPLDLDLADAVVHEPHELHEWRQWLTDVNPTTSCSPRWPPRSCCSGPWATAPSLPPSGQKHTGTPGSS